MAAEIHSRPQSSRPVLLSKIEGHQDAVTAALLIPKEDGVITASEDRTIRVWLKRDSGQYWPSIYHTLASPCSAMTYHHESRRIFVGQDNGSVMEFHVSEDFNKMNFIRTYAAHQNRVSSLIFSVAIEWVISTGHDKCACWMCTRTGDILGTHLFPSWASCLQFDFDTQYAFVGDFSGNITLLKLERAACSLITTLKGHEGGVTCLWWDPIQRLLFSGASDNSIIMWDIGGRKGRTILLQGHHDRVQSLCYLQLTRQLVSCSSDGGIAVWNMDVNREEAPQWLESDSCQKCEQPFFWNIKQMWDTKTLGLRQKERERDRELETSMRENDPSAAPCTPPTGDVPTTKHHCRKCGQAVCGKCSSKRSTYPVMGFEFQVRMCDSCYDSIKDEDRTSLATFHEGKHNISHMSMDVARGLMVTCGTDRVVKIWDMTPVVGCSLATGFSPH
ncbi:WD repeat and FYVE domain-containing protein 1 isoform X1 [Pipistrellus kuhlii]|uniref:WD repeat and FYVE domain-containing protein 1 isoform X1 n=2 Tax=Pipistrellus kuhlii TaxID=59472 RepID=UPI001E272F59|nr:WD repeat and FYVE domain-containing protein 1 isoform X1 [Pipistrellus kuhlii]